MHVDKQACARARAAAARGTARRDERIGRTAGCTLGAAIVETARTRYLQSSIDHASDHSCEDSTARLDSDRTIGFRVAGGRPQVRASPRRCSAAA